MENSKLFELIDRFDRLSISSLTIKDGEFEIAMKKEVAAAPSEVKTAATPPRTAAEPAAPEAALTGKIIKAPIVGTFYAAPSPEKPAFVTEGSRVSKGDTVCVIEAMKMFNEITSDYDGAVKEILVSNGDNIEYGQPLIVLE
jgi:acetyl-CoA carboxylase biotin carboxyl carrier protein